MSKKGLKDECVLAFSKKEMLRWNLVCKMLISVPKLSTCGREKRKEAWAKTEVKLRPRPQEEATELDDSSLLFRLSWDGHAFMIPRQPVTECEPQEKEAWPWVRWFSAAESVTQGPTPDGAQSSRGFKSWLHNSELKGHLACMSQGPSQSFFPLWPRCAACMILVPQPGIEGGPWQWKHRVLMTGPPGNSPKLLFPKRQAG